MGHRRNSSGKRHIDGGRLERREDGQSEELPRFEQSALTSALVGIRERVQQGFSLCHLAEKTRFIMRETEKSGELVRETANPHFFCPTGGAMTKDPFVEDYDNLMHEVGQTVQGIGRMMQSRFGLSEKGHDDLVVALLKAARVIIICKYLEYPDVPPMTVGDLFDMMFDEEEEDTSQEIHPL